MRRALSPVPIAVLCLIVFVTLRAAERPPEKSGLIGALVVKEGLISRDGIGRMQAIRITDPSRLAKLESFFPGYDRRPVNNTAAGWEAGYRVYFDFPHGRSVRVTVSENATDWSVGQGDFATRGDFTRFVESLIEAN